MRPRTLTLVLALVLVVAACGDDVVAPTTTEPTPGTPEPTTAPETPSPPAPGAPGVFTLGECLEITMLLGQAASLGMLGGGSIDEIVASLEALAEAVPAEVAADVLLVASAFADFGNTLADAGLEFGDPAAFADPQAQQVLATAADAFEASGAPEAADRIGEYMDEACGHLFVDQ